MDVRCPVCSTEYELDDARVPESGLPVKCSKCGHVFRASKNAPAPASTPQPGGGQIAEWMIRRAGGETVRFRELTTLQRWIVERKVTRTDEISKTGKKWEKLGNIPELAIFFQVVESQTPANTPPPPPVATDIGMPSQPVLAAQAQAERRTSTDTFTLEPSARTGPDPFSETMPDATGQYMRVAPPTASAAPAPDLSPPSPFDTGPGRSAVPVHIDGLEHRAATVPWQSGLSSLDDDVREEYELGARPRDALLPRKFGPAQILLLGVVVIAAIVAVFYVARPSWVTGLFRQHVTGHAPESMRNVNTGYGALRGDTAPAIDEAIQAFELAVKRDDAYELAYAGLAEALTARAELQRDLADYASKALSAATATDPASELAKIAERRRTADADLLRADAAAKKALELDDKSVDANRAMLDLSRVRGDTTPLDTYAVRAQANNSGDARLQMVLGAWTMRDSAARSRALKYLESAVEKDPQLAHAHYLLAKLAMSAGDNAKAREQAEKVLAIAPQHERASAMIGGLTEPVSVHDRLLPDPAPQQAPAPGPPVVVPQPPVKPEAPTKPEAPAPVAVDPTSGPKTADDPSLTFAEAVSRGDFFRNHDKPAQAVKFYDRAAKMRPTDADAWLGMGWSKLDLHDSAGAVNAFQRALNLAPRLADASFGMAEAYKARGNKLYAIRYYKQYLEISPSGPEADVARSLIEKLDQDNSGVSPTVPSPSADPVELTPEPAPTPPPPPPPPSLP